MTPGIPSLVKHNFAVIEYMLKGFSVTTESTFGICSFTPTTKIIFCGKCVKKSIEHELHDTFRKIVNK